MKFQLTGVIKPSDICKANFWKTYTYSDVSRVFLGRPVQISNLHWWVHFQNMCLRMLIRRFVKKSKGKSKHLRDVCWQFLLSLRHLFVSLAHLFCLHFCLLSHFEIIRCIVKSLVATSTYFLLKYNWQNKTWKVILGRQSLGTQTSIPVSQTACIRPWIYWWECEVSWNQDQSSSIQICLEAPWVNNRDV